MEKKAKFILIFCLLFCVTGSLFALDLFPLANPLISFSPELTGHTRTGWAIGGGLSFGFDLTSMFQTGLRTAFFHNLYTVGALEIQAYIRSWLFKFSKTDGLFFQTELGNVLFFEYGETFPSLLGGWAVGWHLNYSDKWFFEPTLRLGLPHVWGINVAIGYKFTSGSGGGSYVE